VEISCCWGLPGGLMGLGESTEDTARREVLEETGVTIGKLNLIDVFSGPDNFLKIPNGDEFYSVTVAYYTNEVNGDLVIDESESLGFSFVDIDKLPENIVGSHRKMITRFLEILVPLRYFNKFERNGNFLL
jgi:ADP-ribose pyrophosphatase YjhB (NUDIX family)